MDAVEFLPATAPARALRPERGHDRRTLERLLVRQRQRLEFPVDDLAEFFGDAAESLVTVEWLVTVQDYLMAQRALVALLDQWRPVRSCRYDGVYSARLEHHAVAVGRQLFDFAVREGRQFWQGPGDDRLVLDLEMDDDPKVEWSRLQFTVPCERHEWLRQLLPRLSKWVDANHFMRGQAFSAEGKFISLPAKDEWPELLIPDSVRTTLERHCIGLLAHRDLFRANGIPLRRGILLHGKPGTGKTMIGRALARRCGVTFILATPGMLALPRDVHRVFAWGRRFAPSILFFEDFDLVASERRGGGGEEILGEFLAGLDGLENADGIISIATTNDLEAIEPAIKDRPNRFDIVLKITPLDENLRLRFLERWCSGREGDVDVAAVARRAKDFTGAQLQELCRLAVFEAVDERIDEGRVAPERVPLATAHFDRAFAKLGVRRRSPIGFAATAPEEGAS